MSRSSKEKPLKEYRSTAERNVPLNLQARKQPADPRFVSRQLHPDLDPSVAATMTVRQRGNPKPAAKESGKEKESAEEKPKSKSGPFSGRFNPK